MAECAKNLSQFNRGTSAMQHYVGLHPMFDVEVMNTDARLVLGNPGDQPSPSNVVRGLSSLYKDITDPVRKESATITSVFPSPNDVMSILVQYLRMVAVSYEKTHNLSRDLRSLGCSDLDIEGLMESLFFPHKDTYIEYEQSSLRQLYKAKMEELRAESQQSAESAGTIGRSKGASIVSSQQQISVTVVTEFVRRNEEAISRCALLSSQDPILKRMIGKGKRMEGLYILEAPSSCKVYASNQPATLAANVQAVFTCLLDHVSLYITEGLERARDSLTEAAALRERFVLGTIVSRRVAAAAASAAEAAAAAGESSFRSFMVAIQRCGSSVAIVQQYFVNYVSWFLLPVDGAHTASYDEMATAMSSEEGAAYKGLQQCIETVVAEAERLLSAEQKATDYCPSDDGIVPDHRPTNACSRVVAYHSRVLEAAFTALEGLNKQAFLTELGNHMHKGLLNHWQKFAFNPSGGLRLKRDITEYSEFVRSFNSPTANEKFELLGIMANVFIVAPESLSSLFEGTPSIRKDAQRSQVYSAQR